MAGIQYRPDVDGLRAVAVALVLLYHAGFGVSGGFVGVDVFFVISGFLITSLILRQQAAGEFSLRNFWSRRIRRIMPAAAVMTATTLLAGAVLLFPDDFCELAEAVIAQQFLVSNIYFWRTTGYFEGPADLKPLLHTWSLAVEEQFYLLYPFVLVVLRRWQQRHMGTWLAAAGVLSLVLSEWGVRNSPGATFYLLPTRAWELLLGGLICFMPPAGRTGRLVWEGTALAGCGCIAAAGLVFTSSTPFPGVAAMLPCFGAAALIYANSGELTSIGRFLATKPVVFVGLISYSLYLWHWPVLAYLRYWLGADLSAPVAAAALTGSFFLAVLSWRFVERPFRIGFPAVQPWRVVGGICAAAPILVLLSLAVLQGGGYPGRMPARALEYESARGSREFLNDVDCETVVRHQLPKFGAEFGERRCLVWGDSHAMSLVPGLDQACRSTEIVGLQATHSSTAPVLDLIRIAKWGLNEQAPAFSRAVVDFAKSEKIDVVFLSAAWASYSGLPKFEERLRATILELAEAGIRVVVVLDVATFEEDIPLALARGAMFNVAGRLGVSAAAHYEKNRGCNEMIRRAAEGRAMVVDPAPFFVDTEGFWPVEIDRTVLYRDNSHLTVEGSRRLKDLFVRVLQASPQGP